MGNRKSKELSELELVTLAIVGKNEPCTAYFVTKELAESSCSYLSGSAGAVYPAVDRLLKRKFLKSKADIVGRRPRRIYTITTKGVAVVERWLTPPLSTDVARLEFDPIRTRTFFLELVTLRQRRAFALECRDKLIAQIPIIEEDISRCVRSGDRFGALAMCGALAVTRARLEWIEKLRKELGTKRE